MNDFHDGYLVKESLNISILISRIGGGLLDTSLYKRRNPILSSSFPSCWKSIMYNSNFGGRSGRPREMTKVICSDCGKECEVPFKPTEGRPVYCQDCLPKHRRPRF